MPGIVKKTVVILGVLLVAFVAWVFRPYAKVDATLVDPRLRVIEEPCQSINFSTYGDGGSIGIEIIDRTGRSLEFCLPATIDEPSFIFNKLFIGACYYSDAGASEVLNPRHTKFRLAEILRSVSFMNGDNDVAVYRLSGRWRDSWRYFRRAYIFRLYKDDTTTVPDLGSRLDDALKEHPSRGR